MRHSHWRGGLILSIAALTAAPPSTAAPTRYFVETIPALPATFPRSQANAINEEGLAVGLSNIPGNSEAFTYDDGVTSSLGNLGLGAGFTSASGVNDQGVVVGTGSVNLTGDFRDRAFVWEPGAGFTAVLDPEGADLGANANDVNNAGQVLGVYRYSGFDRQGFVYQVGDPETSYELLPFLPGSDTAAGARQFANAINESGVIAGAARTASGQPTGAVRWTPDGVGGWAIEQLAAPTATTTFANSFGINDQGDIVGSFTDGAGQAVLWEAGGAVTPLGVPAGASSSTARDINNPGSIVGDVVDGSGNYAFVHKDGILYDLNTLIDGPSDFASLTNARGINDAGQIVGWGELSAGGIRGFVLTPVPEPATAVLALLAGAAGCSRRR